MKNKDFTAVTLIGVALDDENTFWLCEPINSKQFASGEWKSLKCRWLYPVDSSISRFADVAGFEHTDSVYELDLSAISRVERFAAIDLNVQAKRQKVDRGVFFFVPAEEMHRLDERYKQLLRKEIQLQQQRQEEQQRRGDELVKDEEGATDKHSVGAINDPAIETASQSVPSSSFPPQQRLRDDEEQQQHPGKNGLSSPRANAQRLDRLSTEYGSNNNRKAQHHLSLHCPSHHLPIDAPHGSSSTTELTHEQKELSAAEHAMTTSQVPTPHDPASVFALRTPYQEPGLSDRDHTADRAFDDISSPRLGDDGRSLRRQAFAAFLDDVSARSESPHQRGSPVRSISAYKNDSKRSDYITGNSSSYTNSNNLSNGHMYYSNSRKKSNDNDSESNNNDNNNFATESARLHSCSLRLGAMAGADRARGGRRKRYRHRRHGGAPSHKRKAPHLGTTIYHTPILDEPMGDHSSCEAFDWPQLCIVHRGSVDYLCPALCNNDFGFRLHRIRNDAFSVFMLFSSEMRNSYTLDPPASGVPVFQSAVLIGEGSMNNRVLVITRRQRRHDRGSTHTLRLESTGYYAAEDDSNRNMDGLDGDSNDPNSMVSNKKTVLSDNNDDDDTNRNNDSGRQVVRTCDSVSRQQQLSRSYPQPRQRYRRRHHGFRDSSSSDDDDDEDTSTSSSEISSNRPHRGRRRYRSYRRSKYDDENSSSDDAGGSSSSDLRKPRRRRAPQTSSQPTWQRKDEDQAARILSEGLVHQSRGPGRPTRALQLARAAVAAAAAQGVSLRDAQDAMNAVRLVTARKYAPRARIDLSEAALTGARANPANALSETGSMHREADPAHAIENDDNDENAASDERDWYVAPRPNQLQAAGVNLWTDPDNAILSTNALTRRFGFTREADAPLHTTVFEDGSCVTYTPASASRVASLLPPSSQPTAVPAARGGGRDHDDLDMRGLLEHIQLAKEQVNQ